MSPRKRAGTKKTRSGGRGLSLFRTLALVCVVLLTGLTLFVFMRLDLRPPRTPATQERASAPAIPPVAQPSPSAPSPLNGGSAEQGADLVYETSSEDFEARVRNVDLAILQALDALGEPRKIMHHRAVEARVHDGQEFFYQNLTISLGQDVFPFLANLRRSLDLLAPEAVLTTVDGDPRDLEIAILGEPTHHLYLPLPSVTEPPVPESPPVGTARLVIVIDDLGESLAAARRLAALPFPVSFSVLPHATRARESATLARRKGLELLLHLPSEPDGYPKSANSGPGTLRVDMSPAVLEQTLADNLSRLPEVDGVNNHMGSRLTRDRGAMTVVLAHLKGRGKFFLDSLTTSASCVREVSRSLGMPYYRRHIFLDNTATERAVLMQLKKAESLARRTGLAVAIGHPYPATLSALEAWAKDRDMRVVICKVQDI